MTTGSREHRATGAQDYVAPIVSLDERRAERDHECEICGATMQRVAGVPCPHWRCERCGHVDEEEP